VRADVVIACDGINSAVRKQFYPDDKVAFSGINTWRGVTRRKPILGGRTYVRVGSILTGKMVIYPIIDNVDDDGNQLINWMAEIKRDTTEQNDWNKPGVTLAGDAAHPMYPRGSNGAAQAAIDARTLADLLKTGSDPRAALKAYEAARVAPAAKVVRTNREQPPDFIKIKVEELVGDRPFDNLDKYITQDELRALSEGYKRVAGFALADVTG
jgi:5-methylphenazine-1-carboxylate 1-monooxygenase